MTSILSRLYALRKSILTALNSWLQYPIMASILLASIALAYIASLRQMQLVLGLAVGGCAILFLLKYPQLGILIVIISGFTIPFLGPGGLNASIILLAALLGLWVLEIVTNRDQSFVLKTAMVKPLLGLLAVSFISYLIGQLPWFPFSKQAPIDAQLGGLAIFIFSIIGFFLTAIRISDESWLKWMMGLTIAFGVVYLIGRLTPELSQITRRLIVDKSVGGVFWAWFAPLTFSQAIFNKKLHPAWRGTCFLLVGLSVYVGFFQNEQWKSGWVPPFVGLAAILAFRSWRLGVLAGLLGILPAMPILQDALANDAYSVSTRLDAWAIMVEIIKVNPVFGLGFANYYWYTPLFSIRGFDVRFNSHNNYIDIIAQTGVLGLGFFLWFFWEAMKCCWQLRDKTPEGSFAQAYVYGAFGGIVGTLVAGMLGDWILPFVYNVGLPGIRTGILAWFFIGGLVVIEKNYGTAA